MGKKGFKNGFIDITECFCQDVKEFCENIERERVKTVALLSRMYSDIGDLITKIEHSVYGTNSGKAKSMASYYMYWERKVLDSLVKMVLR